jgi:hypothetical protein
LQVAAHAKICSTRQKRDNGQGIVPSKRRPARTASKRKPARLGSPTIPDDLFIPGPDLRAQFREEMEQQRREAQRYQEIKERRELQRRVQQLEQQLKPSPGLERIAAALKELPPTTPYKDAVKKLGERGIKLGSRSNWQRAKRLPGYPPSNN